MMNYQEMSDRDIDLAVFEAIFGKDVLIEDADLRRAWGRGVSYCNSWSDAGIIIAANRINLLWNMSNWSSCSSEFSGLETNHENPLRAAMVVFLMMKGGE